MNRGGVKARVTDGVRDCAVCLLLARPDQNGLANIGGL
jgi:hypothetical protein